MELFEKLKFNKVSNILSLAFRYIVFIFAFFVFSIIVSYQKTGAVGISVDNESEYEQSHTITFSSEATDGAEWDAGEAVIYCVVSGTIFTECDPLTSSDGSVVLNSSGAASITWSEGTGLYRICAVESFEDAYIGFSCATLRMDNTAPEVSIDRFVVDYSADYDGDMNELVNFNLSVSAEVLDDDAGDVSAKWCYEVTSDNTDWDDYDCGPSSTLELGTTNNVSVERNEGWITYYIKVCVQGFDGADNSSEIICESKEVNTNSGLLPTISASPDSSSGSSAADIEITISSAGGVCVYNYHFTNDGGYTIEGEGSGNGLGEEMVTISTSSPGLEGEWYLLVTAKTCVGGEVTEEFGPYEITDSEESDPSEYAAKNDSDVYFSTIYGAFDATTEGTITLLKDVNGCNIVVNSGKNITLDLNGYTIRCNKESGFLVSAIENKGTLTINGGGMIVVTAGSDAVYGIRNSGILTIEDVEITVSAEIGNAEALICGIIGDAGGITVDNVKITILEETINSKRSAIGIFSDSGEYLIVREVEIVVSNESEDQYSSAKGIVDDSNTLYMEDVIINVQSGNAGDGLLFVGGSATFFIGEVTVYGKSYASGIGTGSTSALTVDNAIIDVTSDAGDSFGITTDGGALTIIGGTINALSTSGIAYGLYTYNEGEITLGIQDGNVSVDNPKIFGLVSTTITNFYDGRVYAGVGTVTALNIESGYIMHMGTDAIGTFHYLKANFVASNEAGTRFATLQQAFNETTTGTITMLADTFECNVQLSLGKTLTLDLNGKSIICFENTTGSLTVIRIRGELIIEGPGTIYAETVGAERITGITIYGEVTLNGVTIDVLNIVDECDVITGCEADGIWNNGSGSTVTINNTKINVAFLGDGDADGIVNHPSGTGSVINSEINASIIHEERAGFTFGISNRGTFNVENTIINVDCEAPDAQQVGGIDNTSGGALTIYSATIKVNGPNFPLWGIRNLESTLEIITVQIEVTNTGEAIYARTYGILNTQGGITTIKSGEIKVDGVGENYSIDSDDATLTLGTEGGSHPSLSPVLRGDVHGTITNFYDGKIYSSSVITATNVESGYRIETAYDAGGLYYYLQSMNPNYVAVNGDGMFFTTLQAAFDATLNGSVTLLTDVTENVKIMDGQIIDFYLNEFTFSCSEENCFKISEGTINIYDSVDFPTETKGDFIGYIYTYYTGDGQINIYGGDYELTLDCSNCTINGGMGDIYWDGVGTGVVTINGGDYDIYTTTRESLGGTIVINGGEVDVTFENILRDTITVIVNDGANVGKIDYNNCGGNIEVYGGIVNRIYYRSDGYIKIYGGTINNQIKLYPITNEVGGWISFYMSGGTINGGIRVEGEHVEFSLTGGRINGGLSLNWEGTMLIDGVEIIDTVSPAIFESEDSISRNATDFYSRISIKSGSIISENGSAIVVRYTELVIQGELNGENRSITISGTEYAIDDRDTTGNFGIVADIMYTNLNGGSYGIKTYSSIDINHSQITSQRCITGNMWSLTINDTDLNCSSYAINAPEASIVIEKSSVTGKISTGDYVIIKNSQVEDIETNGGDVEVSGINSSTGDIITSGGDVEITDGSIPNIRTSGGEVTITGGAVQSVSSGNGNVSVSGGSVHSVSSTLGTITIEGGTITGGRVSGHNSIRIVGGSISSLSLDGEASEYPWLHLENVTATCDLMEYCIYTYNVQKAKIINSTINGSTEHYITTETKTDDDGGEYEEEVELSTHAAYIGLYDTSSELEMTNTTIVGGTYGLYILGGSSDATISDSSISSPWGVAFRASANIYRVIITNCEISGGSNGISSGAYSLTLTGSNVACVSEECDGAYFSGDSHVTINGGTVIRGVEYGVYLSSSTSYTPRFSADETIIYGGYAGLYINSNYLSPDVNKVYIEGGTYGLISNTATDIGISGCSDNKTFPYIYGGTTALVADEYRPYMYCGRLVDNQSVNAISDYDWYGMLRINVASGSLKLVKSNAYTFVKITGASYNEWEQSVLPLLKLGINNVFDSGAAYTYESRLQSWIDSVTEGEATLLGDSSECLFIDTGKTITLNLNGYSINCSTANTPAITNKGNFTLKGAGNVQSNSYGIYNNGGTLTIGVDDSVVSRNEPTIYGGIRGTITSFYDGKIYSSSAISATNKPTGSTIKSAEDAGGKYYYLSVNVAVNSAGTYFDALQGAFDATSSGTITLLRPVSECTTLASGKTIILDLGGYTLTCSSTGAIKVITNNGNLTVKNGTISASSNSYSVYGVSNEGTGTLTVSASISVTSMSSLVYGIYNLYAGTIKFSGLLSVTTNSGFACGIYNSSGGSVLLEELSTSAVISVNGGVGSSVYGIYNSTSGPITVTGGRISVTTSGSTVAAIRALASIVTIGIEGGELASDSPIIYGGITGGQITNFYDGKIYSSSTIITATNVEQGYKIASSSDADGTYYYLESYAAVDNTGEYFDTLQEGVTSSSTGILTLLKNVNECIEIDDATTLDLNGNNISCEGTRDIYAIYIERGNVTIKGSGEISATGTSSRYKVYGVKNDGSGTVTIEGPTIKSISLSGSNAYGIYNYLSGKIELKGGKLVVKVSQYGYGIYNNYSNGSIVVSGGEIDVTTTSSYSYGIYNSSSGSVTVSGGKVDATSTGSYSYGIYNYSTGFVTVSGGEVGENSAYGIHNRSSGELKISGGTIRGAQGGIVNSSGTLTLGTLGGGEPLLNPIIYGGITSGQITNFYDGKVYAISAVTAANIEPGYGIMSATDANGTYYYLKAYVAKNSSDVYFTSLQGAINSEPENGIVTLLLNTNECVTIDKNMSLILNADITCSTVGSTGYVAAIYSSGDLSITGTGNIISTSNEEIKVYGIEHYSGKLIIDGIKISAIGTYITYGLAPGYTSLGSEIKNSEIVVDSTGTAHGIYDSNILSVENTNISVKGGSRSHGIYLKDGGTFTLKSGKIDVSEYSENEFGTYGVYIESRSSVSFSEFIMEGGEIIVSGDAPEGIYNVYSYSIITINGGLIRVEGRNVTGIKNNNNDGASLKTITTINGGKLEVIASSRATAIQNHDEILRISGGEIIVSGSPSTNAYGIINAGNTTIDGGKIFVEGSGNIVYSISSLGSLTIGGLGGGSPLLTPEIHGDVEGTITNFYDGKIYSSSSITATNLEDGCFIVSGTDAEGTYYYLAIAIAKNNSNTHFASLQSAIDGTNNGTVTLLQDTNECVKVITGKTITLELNNKTINCVIVIVNTDSSDQHAVIENEGSLTINGPGILSARHEFTGEGNFESLFGIKNKSSGMLTTSSVTINVTAASLLSAGIENRGTAIVNGGSITNASVSGFKYGIYNEGVLSIDVEEINVEDGGFGIFNSSGSTATIFGGIINVSVGEGSLRNAGLYADTDSTTIIGKKDNSISNTQPYFSSNIGIVANGIVKFYDGKIHGVDYACGSGVQAVTCASVVDEIEEKAYWIEEGNYAYLAQDLVAPVLSSLSPNGTNGIWTIESLEITVIYTDDVSSMKSVSYCWSISSSSCSVYITENSETGEISISSGSILGIYYLHIKGTDKVGNESVVTISNAFYFGAVQELDASSNVINYYKTLQDAFDNATSGNTLKLLMSINTPNISLTEGKSIKLNLNSFVNNFRILNYGSLEIENGTIIYESISNYYGIISHHGNYLKITTVTLEASGSSSASKPFPGIYIATSGGCISTGTVELDNVNLTVTTNNAGAYGIEVDGSSNISSLIVENSNIIVNTNKNGFGIITEDFYERTLNIELNNIDISVTSNESYAYGIDIGGDYEEPDNTIVLISGVNMNLQADNYGRGIYTSYVSDVTIDELTLNMLVKNSTSSTYGIELVLSENSRNTISNSQINIKEESCANENYKIIYGIDTSTYLEIENVDINIESISDARGLDNSLSGETSVKNSVVKVYSQGDVIGVSAGTMENVEVYVTSALSSATGVDIENSIKNVTVTALAKLESTGTVMGFRFGGDAISENIVAEVIHEGTGEARGISLEFSYSITIKSGFVLVRSVSGNAYGYYNAGETKIEGGTFDVYSSSGDAYGIYNRVFYAEADLGDTYGILVVERAGSIQIEDGTIDVKGDTGTIYGIWNSNILNILGGTIIATSSTNAIYGLYNTEQNISGTNEGHSYSKDFRGIVTMSGGVISVVTDSINAYGIYNESAAENSLVISGGIINLVGTKGGYGIRNDTNMEMTGGTLSVVCTSCFSTTYSSAIYNVGDMMTLSGGNISIEGDNVFGVSVIGSPTAIFNGVKIKVKATSLAYGVYSVGGENLIEVKGDTIIEVQSETQASAGIAAAILGNNSVIIEGGTISVIVGDGFVEEIEVSSSGTMYPGEKGAGISAVNVTITGGKIEVTSSVNDAIGVSAQTQTITGGEIISSGYAISQTSGTITYSGGILKGGLKNPYTYLINGEATLNIGDKHEYTYIEGNHYVTTLVEGKAIKVGSIEYASLKEAINGISSEGTIVVNSNVTMNEAINIGSKKITLNLNGKVLNNFVVSNGNVVGEQFVQVGNGGRLIVNGSGTLSSASLLVKAVSGGKFEYNGGTLESKVEGVISVGNIKDMYMPKGKHMVYGTNSSINWYKITLGNSSLMNVSETKAIVDNTSLKVTIKHTSGIEVLVYMSDEASYEVAMTCSTSGGTTTCTQKVEDVTVAYNMIYEEELLIYYENAGKTKKEILRNELELTPNYTENGMAKYNYEGSGYKIISDGDIIVIDLYSVASVNANTINTDAALKTAIFGPNWEKIFVTGKLNISVGATYESCGGNMSNVTVTCYKMNISAEFNKGYPSTNKSSFKDEGKIMMYDYTPKVKENVESLSAVTCEMGSACNVSALSFTDFTGGKVSNVVNTITFNGEVVEAIDTNVLGTYVVTSVATDQFGYISAPYIREYKIIDKVAPVIEVRKEAIVIKVGEEIEDEEEIVVYDNVDKLLVIERIMDEVDVNKEGKYKIGYKVVDSSGNITIVYRDVIVRSDGSNKPYLLVGIISSLILLIGIGSYVFIKKKKNSFKQNVTGLL